MMTVSVYDAEVQEVCDAAVDYFRHDRVDWLRKVNTKHSVDWFEKKILEYSKDFVESDGDEEILAVIESLVLGKFAFFMR